jgi:transcription termination/antitermination protein NusG
MNSAISTGQSWESDSGAVPGSKPRSAYNEAATAWYALEVRPKFEKKVEMLLKRKGIETFLPLIERIRHWSDRRKRILTPLFPGYEFIRLQLSTDLRRTILQTAGVRSLVGTSHAPSIVPASQVQVLQQLLHSRAECDMRSFLRVGQKVRICSGALAGIEGILVEGTAKRLVISIDCIQRSLSVVIDGYDIELA